MRGAGVVLAIAGAMLAFGLVGAGSGVGGVRTCVAAVADFPPSTKVVLFTPSSSDPLVARLEAELAAVGISVRRLPMPPDSQLDSVVTTGIASGASAVIRVIPRSRGTEVWTGDTTARVLRRRSVGADTSDAALSVIALRTVEFLRASLLDVKRRSAAGAAGSASAASSASAAGYGRSDGSGVPPAGRPVAEQPAREASAGERTGPDRPSSIPAQPAEAPAARLADTPAVRAAEAAAARAPETPPPRLAETAAPRLAEAPGGGAGEGRAATASAKIDGESAPPRAAGSAGEARRPAAARTEATHFEIAVGPALLMSPGGIAPIASAAAIGRGRIKGNAGIELTAIFPIANAQLNNNEGSVQVSTALFGAALTLRLTPPGPWIADAALGVSTLMLRAAGSGVGSVGVVPNAGRVASAWKVGAHARAGGGVQLNSWLALRIDAFAGAVTSRILIEYQVTGPDRNPLPGVSASRASWGPIFAAGTLGLQANW
jgi:hypothetical protein